MKASKKGLRYAAIIMAIVAIVFGAGAMLGCSNDSLIESNENESAYYETDDLTMADVQPLVQTSEAETENTGGLIRTAGFQITTEEEAMRDIEFGEFMPTNIPSGFVFESGSRFVEEDGYTLVTGWSRGLDTILWVTRTPLESDLRNILSADDREKFDVSLFETPWADSVPIEIHYYFQSPVFLAEEITLDIIEARTRWVDCERGTVSRWETSEFSVLFGDIIVQVSTSGMSAEQVWEMLPL